MTYIILGRITPVSDKHVCRSCGADATLLNTGYEPVTQNHADEFYEKIKKTTNLSEMKKLAQSSPLADAILALTTQEQAKGPPREHSQLFYCTLCLAHIIFLMTNNAGAGEIFLHILFTSPRSHALFVVHDGVKDCVLLIHSITNDVEAAYKMLNSPEAHDAL